MKKVIVTFVCSLFTVICFSQEFDIKRAVIFDSTLLFPYKVTNTVKLSKAIQNVEVKASDKILVADFGNRKIAFLYAQMAYHHVAFKEDSKPWMVSFCVVCNSGAAFYTKIGNTNYHFEGAGLYDGTVLLKDYETGSYWNHITGECVYGKMKGQKLPSFSLLYSTAKDFLTKTPGAEIAISDMSVYKNNQWYQFTMATLPQYMPDSKNEKQPPLGKQFLRTIDKEDTRLPSMALGLGIWNEDTYKFYPSETIDRQKVILEDFGGQKLLIYNNESTNIPFAFFTDAASYTISGNEIHLSNGQIINENGLVNNKGKVIEPKKPKQMFTRWYGFALTFPATTIYTSN